MYFFPSFVYLFFSPFFSLLVILLFMSVFLLLDPYRYMFVPFIILFHHHLSPFIHNLISVFPHKKRVLFLTKKINK